LRRFSGRDERTVKRWEKERGLRVHVVPKTPYAEAAEVTPGTGVPLVAMSYTEVPLGLTVAP
jgi:hypothetical protein